jgi:transposase InsO family protein
MVVPSKSINPVSGEAIFRFHVVSEILACVKRGVGRKLAVKQAAEKNWYTLDGSLRAVSKRSIYRWLEVFEESEGGRKGLLALEPKHRSTGEISLVLPQKLLDFLATQKEKDPSVSIPEVIRRARINGIIEEYAHIDRTTLYRAALRHNIPVKRRKSALERDSRRFAYPHRMDCILCDGKHFRAGATRKKRVALFFLDDATRYALHVVVGSSENPKLFLHGLYELIRHYGLFNILYLDHGPGFIALDVVAVIGNLEAHLIHGKKAYPEGHGKIERFNQTAKQQCLRYLDHQPDVDASFGALELRLGHYLKESYNQTPHESLGQKTPYACFSSDSKPLVFPECESKLREKFVIHFDRTMSKDHIISIEGVHYEMPLGYRDTKVTVYHHLLDESYSVIHNGKLIRLRPVDLLANARSGRAQGNSDPEEDTQYPLPKSAAALAYERDFSPVVDSTGGLTEHLTPEEEEE